MATFSFNDYQNAVQAAQSKSGDSVSNNFSAKVGWFKLANDGDEALVRINIGDVSEMQFASIHQLGAGAGWMKVNCLHELGSAVNNCPFCASVNSGNQAIGKTSKRVYVPMMVSYKDATTGQWSEPSAVIWDRPASFSRELANKLRDFGNLRETMFKITRNGAKGDKSTTYSIDYAVPAIFKPELIPLDFSAFNNFRVDKHSFWVKTAEEMQEYLSTGSFPDRSTTVSSTTNNEPVAAQSVEAPKQTSTDMPVMQTSQELPTPNTNVQTTPQFNNFTF